MPFKHFSRHSLATKSSSTSHGTTPPSTTTTNNTITNTAPHSPLSSYLDRDNSPISNYRNAGNPNYPIQPTYQVTCRYSKAGPASSCKSELKSGKTKKCTQQGQEQERQDSIFLLGRLPLLGRRIQARQEEARALKRNIGRTAPLTQRNLHEFFNPDYREIHDAFCDRAVLSSGGEVSVWEWIGKLPPVSSYCDSVNLFSFVNETDMFLVIYRTEAIEGAIPIAANSPQNPPYGLYAEKLSGTCFTAPRADNQQTWLYRILPTSAHASFKKRGLSASATSHSSSVVGRIAEKVTSQQDERDNYQRKLHYIPNQLRWDPFDLDSTASWIDGIHLVAGAGDPTVKHGLGVFIYAIGKDMPTDEAFYSADGDFLVVPQHGTLDIQTELGKMLVRPNEICVLPRGIKYRITLPGGNLARGYIMELYEGHFRLPELGPIGSNGLANARDFQIPVATFDDDDNDNNHNQGNDKNERSENAWHITCKFAGNLFTATQHHTPFDVVAWHGTYYPFKYDLGRFNTIGTISYDHPDPSIFTVLTSSSPSSAATSCSTTGPIADFVIFPPRWLVAEDTFRPPWFHRNCMSEFMGLVAGEYDAKAAAAISAHTNATPEDVPSNTDLSFSSSQSKGGFRPAGASLHNVMSGHGPDAATATKASDPISAPAATATPQKVGMGSLAFMFESCLMLGVTGWGIDAAAGTAAAIEKMEMNEDEHEGGLGRKYNEESWLPLPRRFRRP